MDMDRLFSTRVPPAGDRHRLFHGRGGEPGGPRWLTLDRYPPVLVATLFSEPPADVLDWLRGSAPAYLAALGCDTLLLQHRYGGVVHNEVVAGALPAEPLAREQGLVYRLDFGRGQNIGFFGDMIAARAWLRERAAGKRVLNLFAFTCSFSVAALAGGAEHVVNIDMSGAALKLGRENHRLNGLDPRRADFLPYNLFRSWKKLHSLGRYDLVVIDPPSKQKGSFIAERDYRRVVRQLHRLLRPEADILACLNAPWLGEDFLDETLSGNLPGSRRVARLPAAPGFEEPGGDPALKVIHYRYTRPALASGKDS